MSSTKKLNFMYRPIPIIKLIAPFCIFLASQVHAQDATPVKPDNYAGPVNYVRTWEAHAPITDPDVLLSRPLKDVKMNTQYVDGLGRPVETVVRQGSLATGSLAVDLVNAQIYDEFGREIRKYLPFASNGGGATNNGSFKTDPWDQQVNFYGNSLNSPIKGQGETFYYAKTEIESSPLNRAERSYAPGNSWVHDGNGVQMKYWTNTDLDQVRIWNVQDVQGDLGSYSTPATNGVYAAGSLYKNVTEDEKKHQVIEFKDIEGKVILKKLQLLDNVNGNPVKDDGTGRGYDGWLCTYYIYDNLNQLRCVIQPKALEDLASPTGNWQLSATALDELCFRYEYDARGRMTMKKVPGSAAVYMVYDIRDRLVMAQDGNMRLLGKWIVTKYDELNRSIETGFWTDNKAFTTHLSNAYTSSSYPNTASSYELLTETHYDDYVGLPAGLQSAFYASGYNAYLDAGSADNADAVPTSRTSLTKGVVTWTREKVLGTTNQFIATAHLYDDKGRVVQTQSLNITGGLDVGTIQYNFSNQIVRNHVSHVKAGNTAIEVATRSSYDDLGRVSMIEKAIGGSPTYKQLSALTYDALGQLKAKKLAPEFDNNTGLETLTNDYNIRGWLLGINKDYLNSASATSSHFGMELNYNKDGYATTANKQYNGNIGSTIWRSQGDGERRKYDFSYDAVNRLLKADFNQQFGSLWDNTDPNNSNFKIDFSTYMGDGSNPISAYDANGNIKRMQQWGLLLGNSPQIDNLLYDKYVGNRLANVTDAGSDPNIKLGDFKDGTNPSGIDDYTYDPNGNLIVDNNKAISSITYNYLNLPEVVTLAGKGTITYTYDAAGNKLKKFTVDNTVSPAKTTTTLYTGGFVYENDVLQFVSHEEGRIRFTPAIGTTAAQFNYDYFIKDHLGNVRMVLTDQQQQPDIYQAGMEVANRSFEVSLFGDKINTTETDKPGMNNEPEIFDADNTNNQKVSKVSGGSAERRVGPGVILKVMAGDKIKASTYAWYKPVGTDNSVDQNLAPVIFNLLGQLTPGVSALAKGGAVTQITNSILQPGMENLLGNQTPISGAPKAFLNYVLLDEEQFKAEKLGATPVPVITYGMQKQFLQANNGGEIEMTKNGYLYVFVSNESKEMYILMISGRSIFKALYWRKRIITRLG